MTQQVDTVEVQRYLTQLYHDAPPDAWLVVSWIVKQWAMEFEVVPHRPNRGGDHVYQSSLVVQCLYRHWAETP